MPLPDPSLRDLVVRHLNDFGTDCEGSWAMIRLRWSLNFQALPQLYAAVDVKSALQPPSAPPQTCAAPAKAA
jgi:hypothetical protein